MEHGAPFIRLKLDTSEPMELGEFVGAFTAIAAEYDRFIRSEEPDADPRATLFVKEIRQGCIEAELIPWVLGVAGAAGAAVVGVAASANTLGEFVERYGRHLGLYKKKGAKLPDATITQLRDFTDQVAAIASSPNSSIEIAAIEIKDGDNEIRTVFKFNTSEAREIREHVEDHKQALEAKRNEKHERVLMIFRRTDVGGAKVGKPSGERVRIESISKRNLALIYASELAEARIKHEIADGEDNVYKKGFVVDVLVEFRDDRPIAYSVTDVHRVIDLPDEDEGDD